MIERAPPESVSKTDHGRAADPQCFNTPKHSQTFPNWDTVRSGILSGTLRSGILPIILKNLTQPSQRQSGGAATTHIQQFSPFLSFKKLDAAQPKAERVWEVFGVCWGRVGDVLGTCWGSVGEVLGKCWGSVGEVFGEVLGSVWECLGVFGSV